MDEPRQFINRDDLIEVGVCAEGLYQATANLHINEIDVDEAIFLFPQHEVSILLAANQFFSDEELDFGFGASIFNQFEFDFEIEQQQHEFSGYVFTDREDAILGYGYSDGGRMDEGEIYGEGEYVIVNY